MAVPLTLDLKRKITELLRSEDQEMRRLGVIMYKSTIPDIVKDWKYKGKSDDWWIYIHSEDHDATCTWVADMILRKFKDEETFKLALYDRLGINVKGRPDKRGGIPEKPDGTEG